MKRKKQAARYYTLLLVVLGLALATPAMALSPAIAAGSGVGNIPQGTQTDAAYAASFTVSKVSNVFATAQKISCYRPEVGYFTNLGPTNGYSGMSDCAGAANTGEDIGLTPYATQAGSRTGYPASTPMLVKGHSESDLRVDPTNPKHLIGSSKWFVSPEGYNHQLGFYESFDSGKTWPIQGHIPGYEGWTDNTDPVGAFDGFGNYYALNLPYQFSYDADGTHDFQIGGLPNKTIAAEAIAVAVRPAGSTNAQQWLSVRNGQPDLIATFNSVGNAPDKQWITIDNNPRSPFYNTIYAMWVNFNGPYGSKPQLSTAKALPNGQHTNWSKLLVLPTLSATSADTYLLPHVDGNGTVWTSVTNFPSKQGRTFATLGVIYSNDGGITWNGPLVAASNVIFSPGIYPNTTFRSGILNSFTVGTVAGSNGKYPLYLSWEDYSAGYANIILSASFDGGNNWSNPIQVNDNQNAVDELQSNLTVGANGTVSVAWYDRRLSCPTQGSSEAAGAGLALDTNNPNYAGSLPPYGAQNYCVNASVQYYSANLTPKGHNIRLTANTWDPQLNAPHTSCASCATTFLGDYFGNITSDGVNYMTFVSTYNDGSNPNFRQQQVVARLLIP